MGTSKIVIEEKYAEEDHPHAYGDKKLSYIFHKKGVGSSPRVWGQEKCIVCYSVVYGIIPTRMGTSLRVHRAVQQAWDHPHAYGDKFRKCCIHRDLIGSSPRVWGQVILCKLENGNVRIIPTRMGTRYNRCYRMRILEDHPHAYGDKLTLLYHPLQNLGSSPRVWGQASV